MKAAEDVQQFVRRGFDVLFLSQEALKLEGKGVKQSVALGS